MSWWIERRTTSGRLETWSVNSDPLLVIIGIGLVAILFVPRIIAGGRDVLESDATVLAVFGVLLIGVAIFTRSMSLCRRFRQMGIVSLLLASILAVASRLVPLSPAHPSPTRATSQADPNSKAELDQ